MRRPPESSRLIPLGIGDRVGVDSSGCAGSFDSVDRDRCARAGGQFNDVDSVVRMAFQERVIDAEVEQALEQHAANHLVRHQKRAVKARGLNGKPRSFCPNLGVCVTFALGEAPCVLGALSRRQSSGKLVFDFCSSQPGHVTVMNLGQIIHRQRGEPESIRHNGRGFGRSPEGAVKHTVYALIDKRLPDRLGLSMSSIGERRVQLTLTTTLEVPRRFTMACEKDGLQVGGHG